MNAHRDTIARLNAGYLEELNERYHEHPGTLDRETREYFDARQAHDSPASRALLALVELAEAIRSYGHREAEIDPLGDPPSPEPRLALASYDLSDPALALMPAALVGGPSAEDARSAREAIEALRSVYGSTRGYDYRHLDDPKERDWLQRMAESGTFRPPADPIDPVALLENLCRVEAFETFLHRMLPGKFRFSVEGLDMLVPLLEEILGEAAERDVESLTLGMSHRGRLNVLTHVLQKPYADIMAELRGRERDVPSETSGFRGDVTYHMGATRARSNGETIDLVVTMPPNPSHVEAIDPVVQGMARAAGAAVEEGGAPRLQPKRTLPVLVHGDAAFTGQGVVSETLNLGELPAYRTGGTIHVIANNGLGFTTEPEELRSTRYASDPAKGFDIPVLHVNADDPEAVIEAGRTAVAYLEKFHKDFVIDLVGYRRRGHNESDEPRFTQPLQYERIDAHPTVREKWASTLVSRGVLQESEAEERIDEAVEAVRAAWKSSESVSEDDAPRDESKGPSSTAGGKKTSAETGVSIERLRTLNASLLEVPEGFSVHPKLRSAREVRGEILDEPGERTVDWATAEELAFASILEDGVPIRMTGEDTERGTFSHRHAVLHDASTGERHVPLEYLPQARAAFEIANSPLTENAALGFEVGYSLKAPERLVLWEAQYGDFVNGAQVVIDELVVSARAKWDGEPSLVLLLPHGYEGHGPDHSSGRVERFLSLAADENLRIANVTTAAQYFHLLRRQAALLEEAPRPLVVFTPKGLLRSPFSKSSPSELEDGRFHPVLDDPRFAADDAAAGERRVVLSSGKIHVDIARATEDEETDFDRIPLCRLEELYPFPATALEELLARYSSLETLVWAQEEPRNMGAWAFVRDRLRDLLPAGAELFYVGRERASSPAEGDAAEHKVRQRHIVESALGDGSRRERRRE